MNQEIDSFYPLGKIKLPASKSYCHRALISAFIANKGAVIKNINLCDDVIITLEALKKIGANYILKENTVVFNLKKDLNLSDVEINVGQSASTLRFLLPLISSLVPHVKFVGSESLFQRPLNVYEDILKKQQIKFIKTSTSIEIFSSLHGEDLIVDGNISSQFITGWLFLLAKENKNHFIKVNLPFESSSYVDMTLDVLNKFGVKFVKKDNLIVHSFSQFNYLSYEIEQDFSQLAFFAVLGSLKGQVTFSDLNLDSLQGDKRIIDILMDMGTKIDFFGNEITFMHSILKGIEIDLSDMIDLGPIIFVLASFCYGKTIVKNVKRLKYKESNRLDNMIIELKKAGVDISFINNEVAINGKSSYQGDNIFNSYDDHRIAMALSIFAVLNQGHSIIKNSECVKKSYQNFYEDLLSLRRDI